MKKPSNEKLDLLGVISTIQSRLIALDKKIDALLERSEPKVSPKPTPTSTPVQQAPQPQQKTRPMFTAICADCQKECSIPFKPNGNRPIYCKDCFSRRKVISLSRIGLDDKPKEITPAPVAVTPPVPTKKPAAKKKVTAKKPVIKKKATPKKK